MKFSIYISTVSLLFAISCTAPRATEGPAFLFKSGKQISSENHYKNILITAQGTSGTRLFMEKLAVYLNKTFVKEGIKTTYEYLGADSVLAAQELVKFKSTGSYDGFLNLMQKDETNKATFIGETGASMQQATVKIVYQIVRYNQLLQIELSNIRDEINADATLQLNFDLTKDYYYKDIANKIAAYVLGQKNAPHRQ